MPRLRFAACYWALGFSPLALSYMVSPLAALPRPQRQLKLAQQLEQSAELVEPESPRLAATLPVGAAAECPTEALRGDIEVAYEAFQAGVVGGAWPSGDFLSSPTEEVGFFSQVAAQTSSPFETTQHSCPEPPSCRSSLQDAAAALHAGLSTGVLTGLEACDQPTVLEQRTLPCPAPAGKPRYPTTHEFFPPEEERFGRTLPQALTGSEAVMPSASGLGEWLAPAAP